MTNCEDNIFVPMDLLCEYTTDPIGIDTITPLFSWAIEHAGRGQYQTAYRIIVDESIKNLEANIGSLWDSGKVLSGQASGIQYSGNSLESGQKYYWKVRVWDREDSESSFCETGFFEMGLLEQSDWKGSWIGFAGGWNGSSILLRKEFEIKKEVSRARAYISGLGYYELRINGGKVGDRVLDPGTTDYSKRILYSTYDVTFNLKKGKNVIGIVLGNGWYGIPKALMQMNIDYRDGTRDEVFTSTVLDGGWSVCSGPIIKNSIYGGEVCDARLEDPEWDTSNYIAGDKLVFTSPMAMESPGGKLVSQMMEPIKVVGEIESSKVSVQSEYSYVYDFEQNIAGWVRLEVRGDAGTTISMKYAEEIYDSGAVNQENLRSAGSTDVYILRDGSEEVYSPKFTYHGFRYVQVDISEGSAEILKVTAQIVRSAVEPIGFFECSNSLINQIHRNVWWTEASNLHSIPTDCPQRDERMAWLNDATARAEEAFYNFGMAAFYEKWLDDISDSQDEKSGAITDTAPYRWGFRPADPVSSCYLIIPMLLYRHFGNKRVLEEHYRKMEKWVGYLADESVDFIVKRSHYGDWASPSSECTEGSGGGAGAVSYKTPGDLVSTGFYYLDIVLMSQIAHILGKYDEEKKYFGLAKRVKSAFNRAFFDSKTNNYAGGSQGSNALALNMGLVPKGKIRHVVDNLVYNIVQVNDCHLSTGNQCTKHMLEVLASSGHMEEAYKVVTQTTYPSWGFMISKGATTIWERWEQDATNVMNSKNHPMHASVGSWFYKVLAGISADDAAFGFDRIIIRPYPAADLSFVNASLKTVKGLVEVRWTKNDGVFALNVNIPANSVAKVCIPIYLENAGAVTVREGSKVLWNDGIYIGGIDGVFSGVLKGGFVEFQVGSGLYCFASSNEIKEG